MNLQRSDAQLRFEMQQIEGAETCGGGRSPNPFAALLGIAFVVLLVWTAFALAPIAGRLVALARAGATYALSLL